ncbi:FKBP-type peptidyl-prolyl cis-trans isomerase [Marinobacterium lutimaris]|uniref:peptidylprolyl isomerase n=1 Tax=Marinobacterium lutimaris TaxID=568106 RepID=A0A1H6DNA9_9GAMM|nr:peptidylprolyl isomerase [Marinobacterium lutimaris]SEG86045.1 FKBP-type peptidyl prolyl cis-trans isomerase /Apo-metallochaperone SlyD [Marinobacterium lutimaris]
MKITQDSAVFFRYSLAPVGEPLAAPTDEDPVLSYLHGHGQIVPGLEAALEGREAGESFSIELSAEQAYGPRDESLIETVEREAFAGVKSLRKGALVQVNDESGKPALARVLNLDTREVELDLNHPYAGMDLAFNVAVVDVRAATEQELADLSVSN